MKWLIDCSTGSDTCFSNLLLAETITLGVRHAGLFWVNSRMALLLSPSSPRRQVSVEITMKSTRCLRPCTKSLRFNVQTTCHQDINSYLRVTWADDGINRTSMHRLLRRVGNTANGRQHDNARMLLLAMHTTFVAPHTWHRLGRKAPYTRRGRCDFCTQRPQTHQLQ